MAIEPTPSASCENCKYLYCDIPGQHTGICRRYPPTVIDLNGSPTTRWPTVSNEHWCGEHVYKPVRIKPFS